MTVRWSLLLIGTVLAVPLGPAGAAPVVVIRDLAARVGPVAGLASPDEADRDALIRNFNGFIAERRNRMAGSQPNCRNADRQFTEFDRSLSNQPAPASSGIIAPLQPGSIRRSRSNS
jgi:hypothetical protein